MTPEQRALMERMEERFVYAPEAHAIRAALEEIDRLKAELERTQEERSEWKYKEYERSERCLRLLDRALSSMPTDAPTPPENPLRAENEPEECGSCRGCGHFSKYGKPSVDRRDRNCMDCSGTGRALKGTP